MVKSFVLVVSSAKSVDDNRCAQLAPLVAAAYDDNRFVAAKP